MVQLIYHLIRLIEELLMKKIESNFDYTGRIIKVLITEQQIDEKIKEIGEEISKKYSGKRVLLVSILKGSFIFLSDLCRAITIPCEIEFMSVKSYYYKTESSGQVKVIMGLERNIEDYHVIIVEDIVDTGRSLSQVVSMLKERNPLSVSVVTLLDKPDRRVVDFQADCALFVIPDVFVIGYGLDCAEYYRNLPYIAEYSEEK